MLKNQKLNNKINVIWNITRLCPFKCSFCCVSAIYIKGFRQVNTSETNKYKELSFSDKVKIIEQMNKNDFSIDFSGGDVLIDPNNLKLIKLASNKFGKENIGLSIPGTFLTEEYINFLKDKVNDIELTLDSLPNIQDKTRPLNYSKFSSIALEKLVKHNVNVGVQTVLNHSNMSKKTIYSLFEFLEKMGIKKWSLLKFFPVGNFYGKTNYCPSDLEYIEIGEYIKKITKKSNMQIHFQYLYPQKEKSDFTCRAVNKSIGINAMGKVSSCFWALDKQGNPLDSFYLGTVPKENIYDILKTEKAYNWGQQYKKCNNCELQKHFDKNNGLT